MDVKKIIYPIFEGTVAHGFKIGETLGFPTANIEVATENIPQDGVYIVQIQINDAFFYGMMSIGNRPTFNAAKKTIEVHLLNFSGDLYQQNLSIKPLSYIRKNRKFDNLELLKQQLQKDKNLALQYAKNENSSFDG